MYPAIVAAVVLASLCACSVAAVPTQVDGPPIGVCDAARRPIGARVLVQGEFGGFGYETESKRVTIHSEGLCSERGAGLLFVELNDREEGKKLYNARPRPKRRTDYALGDTVLLETTILKVDDGRFTHGNKGIVRSVSR